MAVEFGNVSDDFAKLGVQQVEKAALAHLSEKYGEAFECEFIKLEFDGQDAYYRMVFRSQQRPEEAVLYCREQGQGDALVIDGVSCVITDGYANVLLQEQYAAQLQALFGDGVLVKCQLKTPNGMISGEDFAAGLKACVEDPAYGVQMYVVILADASARDSGLREKAEQQLGQLDMYRQYLYVAYVEDLSLPEWEQLYLQNQKDFARYVADRSEAVYVEFTSFHAGEGIVKQSVVKE